MNINRRKSVALLALVVVTGLFFYARSRDQKNAETAGRNPPPAPVEFPALAASEISPQQLLSDAAGMTAPVKPVETVNESTGVVIEAGIKIDAAVLLASSSPLPPPRVGLSKVFAPYASPSSMISLTGSPDQPRVPASPEFLAFKTWTESQAAGSGNAYLNLTAMLGAAPTGEVVRRTWIEVDTGGSRNTNVSSVLAMLTERPDQQAPVPEEASASDPQSIARVMYYVREGDARMSEGLLEEAAKAYTDALAIYPQLTYANQQVGRLNLVLGNYDAAIRNLQAALEASDDIGETLNDLGVAFMYAGRIDEALESFEAALQAEPEQVDPIFNTGLALRQAGRLVDAREQFNTYLNIIPRDARAMRELAVIDMLENQRETALRRLIIAIEYDDTWATPMLDAALLFAEMGINDRALALMEKALDRAAVREVYQVYMQDPFRNIRLSPEGKPFEAKLAAKARAGN